MFEVTPFRVNVADEALTTIYRKVAAYDWHETPLIEPGENPWAYGVDGVYLQALCQYWVEQYDWRAAEAGLNRFNHFKTDIGDIDLHYIKEEGSGSNPKKLLMLHGWPSSVYEFDQVIERLAHPERFGGNADEGVTVIVPSLPGYGFSGKPAKPVGPMYMAKCFDTLMREVLGCNHYIAHGGDWGSTIASLLGYHFGQDKGGACEAIHLTMAPLQHPDMIPETDDEKAWKAKQEAFLPGEWGYMYLQSTRPQTLSYGMMDSPVGVAAWLVEKFYSWADTRAIGDGSEHIENAFSKDQLLTNIMIYLVTRSFNTAAWSYYGQQVEQSTFIKTGTRIEIPVGVGRYLQECYLCPPKRMLELGYNLVYFDEFEKGGHFAAMEQPEAFAQGLQKFLRCVSRRS